MYTRCTLAALPPHNNNNNNPYPQPCSFFNVYSVPLLHIPLSKHLSCIQTEIIPLCLRIMETGSELSKTVRHSSHPVIYDSDRNYPLLASLSLCHFQVATFIVQKILLDDVGLNYICATADRFFAVSTVLANMVLVLVETPSHR